MKVVSRINKLTRSNIEQKFIWIVRIDVGCNSNEVHVKSILLSDRSLVSVEVWVDFNDRIALQNTFYILLVNPLFHSDLPKSTL